MRLVLKIWRQKSANAKGALIEYTVDDALPEMSFLELLDHLNERLIQEGKDPVAFDHDCREGICGQCGVMINGRAHGPLKHTTTCTLHLRSFRDGDTLVVEPFRSVAFPIKKDLRIDRSALDQIVQSGGYISVRTGQAPEANSMLIASEKVEEAFDAAACIACGACVASCKNGSAALFTAAKIVHLAKLPQGQPEHKQRTIRMVQTMDDLGFGTCSNTGACEVECPQAISIIHISDMNRFFFRR